MVTKVYKGWTSNTLEIIVGTPSITTTILYHCEGFYSIANTFETDEVIGIDAVFN